MSELAQLQKDISEVKTDVKNIQKTMGELIRIEERVSLLLEEQRNQQAQIQRMSTRLNDEKEARHKLEVRIAWGLVGSLLTVLGSIAGVLILGK